MPQVRLGSKTDPSLELVESAELIVVRTRSRRSLRLAGPVPAPSNAEIEDLVLELSFAEAGVEVLRLPAGSGSRSIDDRKSAIRALPDIEFAGGVLTDATGTTPVIYTENFFVKFVDSADIDDCRQILQNASLNVKSELKFAANAFFASAPAGTGQAVFEIANRLLDRADIEYCHPELILQRSSKSIAPQQWHLGPAVINGINVNAHASVADAHTATQGQGTVIAVIDDGIDIDHPEFSRPGKVVFPWDATLKNADPRPKSSTDNHGTACAGVACADGVAGATGVAPQAKLMPIRLRSGLGSIAEAAAFQWAADNGADVISCSWGPPDGKWYAPNDPVHNAVFPIPASTRIAIEYAVTNGRGGKGAVILFAAGNGNETVENDGYASFPSVIAVAACNDTGRRSVYSDFGRAVWCSFPSGDFGYAPLGHPAPLTAGIWTTDRSGVNGYNRGNVADGDAAGMYTNSFSGTSSACPGAAGVAALVLATNPELSWYEVREVLKNCCDRIDPSTGQYDATGHSPFYGFGRLNAAKAVQLAAPQPQNAVLMQRRFDSPIPDMTTVDFPLDVAESAPIAALEVGVQLKHSYIADLRITLLPPGSPSSGEIMLWNRAGGNQREINRSFDAVSVPALAAFAGKSCNGRWTLRIQDTARQDTGTLTTFSLKLSFLHRDAVAVPLLPAAPPTGAPANTPQASRNDGRTARRQKKAKTSR